MVGESLNEEKAGQIASDWLELADTDCSGTIGLDEFEEFILKIDDSKTKENIKKVFEEQD